MTTIAWDGRTLAADRQMTDSHNGRIAYVGRPKIARTSTGLLIGTVGCTVHGEMLERWMGEGGTGCFPQPPFGMDEVAYLYAFSPDRILAWHGAAVPIEIAPGLYAKGSGGAYALGAMAAGRSAKEAVEIASIYDCHTGGQIDVLGFSVDG